jgi:hypothetical protein
VSKGNGVTKKSAVDILARFFPRSAESREVGLSVGELDSSDLGRGAILTYGDRQVTRVTLYDSV